MGEVFRAYDLTTRRHVALKVMRAATGDRARARFVREGELTAKLDHPGILRIFGGGVTLDGCPFLVLELVEGARTLDEVLPEDFARGLHLLCQVARAVGHAHQHGVVHRDLKPGNVLVDRSGRLRVCDFGIAWSGDADRLTRTGELVGTLAYMAPECFSGRLGEVEPTVDVWALGVILYKHLAGRLPFDAGSMSELMARISSGRPVPPRRLRPQVFPAIEAVCLRALAPEAASRYPNGDAFAEALAQATARGGRARALSPVAFGLGGLGLLALLLFFSARSGDAQRALPAAKPPSAAAAEVGSTTDVAAADSLDAERAFEEVARDAHTPIGFRPRVLDAFDRVRRLAEGAPALAARVRLERLDYLFRRGRWEQVQAELPTLERDPGWVGARATLLHALLAYSQKSPGSPAEAAAMAACRERWGRPAKDRGALELACGAWLAIFEQSPDVAVERAQKAQRLDPDLLPALLAEAVAWGRLLNVSKTLALVERARALVPDHPTPLFLLVVSRAYLKEYQLVAEAAGQALALVSPDPPWAACKLYASSLIAQGRLRELEEFAEQGLARHPSDPRWRFVLGLMQHKRRSKPWHGLRALKDVQVESPAVFREQLAYFVPRHTSAEVLLRKLREPSAAQLRAGVIFEEAMTSYAADDLTRCGELLQEAAAAGSVDAMFLLGESYSLGRGLPKDQRLAVRWLREAAEAGSPGGAFSLGLCYAKGRGVRQDRAEAFRWYRLGAERGYVKAMVNLSVAYRAGWVGAPDDAQAAIWLERAAQAGDPLAMVNLGKLYAGTGDPAKALRWWREAVARGEGANKAQAANNIRILRARHPELR